MLKIKDNVDLKELEKFGFKTYAVRITNDETGESKIEDMYFQKIMFKDEYIGLVSVDNETREVFSSTIKNELEVVNHLIPLVKKLKQAGLIEKVSEQDE